VKVKITTDVKKLWSCRGMANNSPEHKGKLPSSSGQPISLVLPGERSNFCDGIMWHVNRKQAQKVCAKGGTVTPETRLCEHQIDFPSKEAERIAKEIE